jgi:excisionase family DNA binding protein
MSDQPDPPRQPGEPLEPEQRDQPDQRDRSGQPLEPRRATSPRFLQLADVAEVLNTSSAQVYALVRSGELPAIKIGGRGQWRVETSELEAYIARMYDRTRDFVTTHRFGRPEDAPPSEDPGGPPG